MFCGVRLVQNFDKGGILHESQAGLRLNVQSAYKRQNTGTGKSHFLNFLEVARQDAPTKWRPNHELLG